MNSVIREIQNTGKVLDEAGNQRPAFPVSISASEGRIIHEQITQIGASRTLEIGFAYGMSTLYICEAIKRREGARHIVIDPYQEKEFQNIGLLNLQKAGLSHLVQFYQQPSHVVLPELLQQGTNIQFALIDGAHLFDYALVDFFYVDKMLAEDGLVCLDDLWMPCIRKLVLFMVRNREYGIVCGGIPRPFYRAARDLLGHLLGERLLSSIARALNRGRASDRPRPNMAFLRKRGLHEDGSLRRETLVNF